MKARSPTLKLATMRKALDAAGIGMAAFARHAGVSRVHIYKVLSGERRPGPVLAARLERLIKDYAA